MRILWFTWKDKKNPLSGGAEVMNEELAERAIKDGHEVTFIVAGYPGCRKEEVVNGYRVIRVGNRFSVYIYAGLYYLKHLRHWPDLIIEEINTIPFLTQLYAPRRKRLLFIYQLAREVWFHELPSSLRLLSSVGYLIEPMYLYLLNDNVALTESASTQKDLMRFGFLKKNVSIIPPGTTIRPIISLDQAKKNAHPTILSLGAIRSMKQTLHQIEAFEIIKASLPKARLIVAGSASSEYGQKVLKYISQSPYKEDIEFRGPVDDLEKKGLMQKAHVILVSSIKEGWGLIITEANSQGTPAVVYNVDGLRDAVRHSETGILTAENSPMGLARGVIDLLQGSTNYRRLQENALMWSKTLNFDESYKEFKKHLVV